MAMIAPIFLLFQLSLGHLWALESSIGAPDHSKFPLLDLNLLCFEAEEINEAPELYQPVVDSFLPEFNNFLSNQEPPSQSSTKNHKLGIKKPRSKVERKQWKDRKSRKLSELLRFERQDLGGEAISFPLSAKIVTEFQQVDQESLEKCTSEINDNPSFKLLHTFFFEHHEYFPQLWSAEHESKVSFPKPETYRKTFFDALTKLTKLLSAGMDNSVHGRRPTSSDANDRKQREQRQELRLKENQKKSDSSETHKSLVQPYFGQLLERFGWLGSQKSRVTGISLTSESQQEREFGQERKRNEELSIEVVAYFCDRLFLFRSFLHTMALEKFDTLIDMLRSQRPDGDAVGQGDPQCIRKRLDFATFYAMEAGKVEISRLPGDQKRRVMSMIENLTSWKPELNFESTPYSKRGKYASKGIDSDQRYLPFLGWAEGMIPIMTYLTIIIDKYLEPHLGPSAHRVSSTTSVRERCWDFCEKYLTSISRLRPQATNENFEGCFNLEHKRVLPLVNFIFKCLTGRPNRRNLYSAAWSFLALWAVETNYQLAEEFARPFPKLPTSSTSRLRDFMCHAIIFDTTKNFVFEVAAVMKGMPLEPSIQQ